MTFKSKFAPNTQVWYANTTAEPAFSVCPVCKGCHHIAVRPAPQTGNVIPFDEATIMPCFKCRDSKRPGMIVTGTRTVANASLVTITGVQQYISSHIQYEYYIRFPGSSKLMLVEERRLHPDRESALKWADNVLIGENKHET